MKRTLDFEAERDREDSTSWERADPVAALIEGESDHSWTVSLPDGEDWHHVVLIFDNGVYVGQCDCEGFEYHEGPCAHLCTIRKADTIGYPDINGESIKIERINRAAGDELADQHDDTERARADGGRRVQR
jgi:hypothetical protein